MIKLGKMDNRDFESYKKSTVKSYANEKIKAGTWSKDEALKKSKDTFYKLLPKGVDTEGQYCSEIPIFLLFLIY